MKLHLRIQSALLAAGVLFAGYNVTKNFVRFYHLEGTIFKVKDCVIPNPVTEPCFYGAIGFIVALIWSLVILQKYTQGTATRLQHYLWWFLSAGTVFALYNVTREFVAFYSTGGKAVGCSGTAITSPFLTPCFGGMIIFLAAAILGGIIYSKLKKS